MNTYISQIVDSFGMHPYAYIFFGLIVAGESVLLPAIYLGVNGQIEIGYVMAIALVATMASDCIWYYIGRNVKNGVYRRIVTEKMRSLFEKMSKAFELHGSKILFFSKFVYGTRVVTHMLCGAYRMPISRYLLVNSMAIISLIVTIVFLAYAVDLSLDNVGVFLKRAEIAFLVLVGVVILVHVSIASYFKKRWMK